MTLKTTAVDATHKYHQFPYADMVTLNTQLLLENSRLEVSKIKGKLWTVIRWSSKAEQLIVPHFLLMFSKPQAH